MTMTLIYAMCVWIAWTPADNAVSYDVYENMTFAFNVPDTQFESCVKGHYYETTYYVVGINEDGNGEPSDTLTVQWVWDFDVDNNGVVGWYDFGQFSNAYASTDPMFDADGSGVVGFVDFGRFSARYGECNNGVWVVPCD